MRQTEATQFGSGGDGREPSQLAAASPHQYMAVQAPRATVGASPGILKNDELKYTPHTLALNLTK